jgi:hypothetical protein
MATPSSVTRTPARAEFSSELSWYALVSAPKIVSADAVSGESAVVEKKIAAKIPWRTCDTVRAPCTTKGSNIVDRPGGNRFLMLAEWSQPRRMKRTSLPIAGDENKALISNAPESTISSHSATCLREVKKSIKPSDRRPFGWLLAPDHLNSRSRSHPLRSVGNAELNSLRTGVNPNAALLLPGPLRPDPWACRHFPGRWAKLGRHGGDLLIGHSNSTRCVKRIWSKSV